MNSECIAVSSTFSLARTSATQEELLVAEEVRVVGVGHTVGVEGKQSAVACLHAPAEKTCEAPRRDLRLVP
jgi:hypothetical protein